MGSFRDIVRSRRGRDGRIGEFKLGFTVTPPKGVAVPSYPLSVTFSEQGSQPVVSSVLLQFDADSFLELRRTNSDHTILRIPGTEVEIDLAFDNWAVLLDLMVDDAGKAYFRELPDGRPIADYLLKIVPSQKRDRRRARRTWYDPLPELIPVAPLRSKPKRTYDPIRETESADGEHVPMLMMRLDRTDKDNWSSLHDDLVEFGRESGLFADIKVRRHGRQMSDPFQLQVKVRSGSHANIMDVGYGVSQSLPILVDVRSKKNCSFLLQQPEVHLHPRAQAELAGLFVQSFRKRGNRFLIETHSDYIIDRVRILVRKRTIKADDVSILYFEPKGNAVTIHSMPWTTMATWTARHRDTENSSPRKRTGCSDSRIKVDRCEMCIIIDANRLGSPGRQARYSVAETTSISGSISSRRIPWIAASVPDSDAGQLPHAPW